MTGDAGHLSVSQLRREGVDVLFSLNGGHIAPIYDACLETGVPSAPKGTGCHVSGSHTWV